MPISLNRYLYAYDNPLEYTDPTGHDGTDDNTPPPDPPGPPASPDQKGPNPLHRTQFGHPTVQRTIAFVAGWAAGYDTAGNPIYVGPNAADWIRPSATGYEFTINGTHGVVETEPVDLTGPLPQTPVNTPPPPPPPPPPTDGVDPKTNIIYSGGEEVGKIVGEGKTGMGTFGDFSSYISAQIDQDQYGVLCHLGSEESGYRLGQGIRGSRRGCQLGRAPDHGCRPSGVRRG